MTLRSLSISLSVCKQDHWYFTPMDPRGIGSNPSRQAHRKLCTSPSGWRAEVTLKGLWVTGGQTVLQDKALKASGYSGCLISKGELWETMTEVEKGQILPHSPFAAC